MASWVSRVVAAVVTGLLVLVSACATGVEGQQTVAPSPSSLPDLNVVVIGDSIAYGQFDCGGCPAFVELYSSALSQRLDRSVLGENFSSHDGLNGENLVWRLKNEEEYRSAVGRADILIISILHNDTPWASGFDTCDGDKGDAIDFSKYTKPCVTAAAKTAGHELEQVFAETKSLRDGKPTVQIVPTIFNDWIEPSGTPRQTKSATKLVLDTYAQEMCRVTKSAGAVCLDVYHEFNGPDGLMPVGDLAADLVHPSAKGHERIAQLLEQVDVSMVTTL